MKIKNDQNAIEALRRLQESIDKKTHSIDNKFQETLDSSVDAPASAGREEATSQVMLPGNNQTGLVSSVKVLNSRQNKQSNPDLVAAYDDCSGTLDILDDYADALKGSGVLRNAEAILRNIEQKIAKLQDNGNRFVSGNPEFGELVNELSVLATTERVKLNRGDYS